MQDAVYTFMEEFVPHMEEEETTFQPLLSQYFQYEELKQLKVNYFIIWGLIVPNLDLLWPVTPTGTVSCSLWHCCGSGIRCLFDLLDPGWEKIKIRVPG